jgi:hypothetical protein
MRKVQPLSRQIHVVASMVITMLASHSLAGADTRTVAAQVAAEFDAQALNAFAAEHPNDPGRFVSALYVGGHILAISAVHSTPAFIRREIAGRNYRYVYSILSTSANRQGRLFVEDFGEPGLHLTRDATGSCDITWRDSTRQTVFDGNWRSQELSEAEYHQRFASDESEYAEMLRVLATVLLARADA